MTPAKTLNYMDIKLNIPHLEKCNQHVVETFYNGELVGECLIQLFEGTTIAHVHHNVYKFNKTIYKEMLRQWVLILDDLREREVTKLITYTKNIYDEKLPKYWWMFGFEEIQLIELDGIEVLYTEMEI